MRKSGILRSVFKNAGGSKIYYGWFVVAACFAVTLSIGEAFWSFGVFFKPLEGEFGWSRAITSSAYTTFLIGFSISLVGSGRLADRYNPRTILIAAALLTGLGIALCSQVNNIDQLRAFFFIAGLGAGSTWSVPIATVQRWFYKRKRAGLALAIVIAGVGFGALVFAPLINHFILSYGWRNAYLIVGILFFAIIAISSLVIRPSPLHDRMVKGGEENIPKLEDYLDWTTSKAVATSSFIIVTFVLSIAVFAFQTLAVHLVPTAIDAGVSPTVSAMALGLLGGFSIPGRIISGLLSDKIGWQKTLAISLFGMALSLLFLIFLSDIWMLYCFVFFFGVCHGIRVPAQVGIIGGFFGMRSIWSLIGITTAVAQLVGAFAPYMAGFIFDATGSYFMAYGIVIILLLIGGLAAVAMKKPSSQLPA